MLLPSQNRWSFLSVIILSRRHLTVSHFKAVLLCSYAWNSRMSLTIPSLPRTTLCCHTLTKFCGSSATPDFCKEFLICSVLLTVNGSHSPTSSCAMHYLHFCAPLYKKRQSKAPLSWFWLYQRMGCFVSKGSHYYVSFYGVTKKCCWSTKML